MKFPSKLAIKASIFGLISICAHAEDKRIYQTDSLGNIQYNKPSYTIQKDGRMIQTDPTGWIKLAISPYKSRSQLLLIPGTKVIAQYSSPLGLISVVKTAVTPLRYAPSLSLNATTEPPEQLAVFTDADNMTAITRYNGNPETISYLEETTSALPYHLKQHADILILGAGTGSDILRANNHEIKHIDAVELNPQVIDLVKEKYADFAGHLYSNTHINLHVGEARGFVATSNKMYDLID